MPVGSTTCPPLPVERTLPGQMQSYFGGIMLVMVEETKVKAFSSKWDVISCAVRVYLCHGPQPSCADQAGRLSKHKGSPDALACSR